MRELVTVTGRDPAGQDLTFTLLSGVTPHWHGEGAEDAAEIAKDLEQKFRLDRESVADGREGAKSAQGAARWLKDVVGCTEVAIHWPPGPEVEEDIEGITY